MDLFAEIRFIRLCIMMGILGMICRIAREMHPLLLQNSVETQRQRIFARHHLQTCLSYLTESIHEGTPISFDESLVWPSQTEKIIQDSYWEFQAFL